MIKHCRKLILIQFLGSYGINEAIYSKDFQKKRRFFLLALCFLIIGISTAFFVGVTSYSLCYIGASKIIPGYMFAVTSILILFFTIFKANGFIFQTKNYEMLAAMPIKPSVIVASRFLNMYVGNFLLSLLVMFPSSVVYVIDTKPNTSFYIMTCLSFVTLPLIPMTIATAIAAVIVAISSRMRYKNLVSIVLSLVFTMTILILSFGFGNIKTIDLANIAEILTNKVNELYLLTPLYTNAVVEGNWLSFVLFLLISVFLFVVFVAGVAWKFIEISTALNSHRTKNNYEISELEQSSPLKALYRKELKRYFSSNIYVLNTSIGYLLMIVLAIAILVMGVDKLEDMMQMRGILSRAIPFVLSAMSSFTTTTVSSISLEGRQWWIPQSLPVPSKIVFDSKILVNLTLSVPTTFLAVVLISIAIPFDLAGYLWLFLTPMVYNFFIAVIGIFINAKMPVFHWENEAVVVKQSVAVFICMLIGFLSVGIPLILLIIFPGISANIITGFFTVLLAIITILFYNRNNKFDLREIES